MSEQRLGVCELECSLEFLKLHVALSNHHLNCIL